MHFSSVKISALFARVVSGRFQRYHGVQFLLHLSMARGKIVYKLAEKQRIVAEAYAVTGNVKATARKYKIHSQNIRNWKKTITGLTDGLNKKRRPSDHAVNLERVDLWSHLLKYFHQLRDRDLPVSVTTLCREARRLESLIFCHMFFRCFCRFDPSFLTGKDPALRARINRFINREGLVHRRRTHIAQNTRHDQTVIDDFIHCVNETIEMMKIPAAAVVNIDETNRDFDAPASTTLEQRGLRSVSVRSTGSSARCTVLLGVSLAGEKLPAFIVFSGTRNGRIIREVTGDVVSRGFPADVVMSVQKKGWIDQELMLEWIDRVWKPWVQQKNFSFSYLLMDSFKVKFVWMSLTSIEIV